MCRSCEQKFGSSIPHRGENFLTVSVLRYEKGPSQPFNDKMSTSSIGGNSGVALTINKGAGDMAQPRRVLQNSLRLKNFCFQIKRSY